MTDDEINASVAEACGWTKVNIKHRSGKSPGATYVGTQFIPNYCNDLNAMHEVEKTLTAKGFEDYLMELFYFIHEPILATARQRAEAFLRTIGKWEPTTEDSSAIQKEVQG